MVTAIKTDLKRQKLRLMACRAVLTVFRTCTYLHAGLCKKWCPRVNTEQTSADLYLRLCSQRP